MVPRGQRTRDNLTVEFLGLPGAGKSTLSHRVAARLRLRGTPVAEPSFDLSHGPSPVQRRWSKAGHILRELLLHPWSAIRATRAVTATQQRDTHTRLLLIANWLLVVALARRARRRSGVHLFDQGLVQAIWSIALEDRDESAFALLRDRTVAASLPDVVVVLQADIEVVRHRLAARNAADSRVERHPDAGASMLLRGHYLVAALRQALTSRDDVRLVVTPCDEADVDRLMQWLERELEPCLMVVPAERAAPA